MQRKQGIQRIQGIQGIQTIIKYIQTRHTRHTTQRMPGMRGKYAHDLTTVLVIYTRGIPDVESRTQGSRPRPRPKTQKKSEAKAKDRPSRSLGQECSRPWPRTKDTSSNVFPKKVFEKIFQAISKKKIFKNFFQAFSNKKRLLKFFFSGDLPNFNYSKKVLSSSRG